MDSFPLFVIGASSGGIEPLKEIVAELPNTLRAAICIAVHVSPSSPSILPQILERSGKLRVMHATDGQGIAPNAVYVAPPDRHLIVHGNQLRLSYEASENGHRPSIDVLFRSAAFARGDSTVGVVLSGSLDDGTAGLREIKRHGGVAIAQDPLEARSPSMPISAIDHAPVDHVLGAKAIARLLIEAAEKPLSTFLRAAPPAGPPLIDERVEGRPSPFSCPSCGGVLFERDDVDFSRYRCHTGHAYSPASLQHAQGEATEDALWSAVRALEERAITSRRFAESAKKHGRLHMCSSYTQRAIIDEERVAIAKRVLELGMNAQAAAELDDPRKSAPRPFEVPLCLLHKARRRPLCPCDHASAPASSGDA